MTAPASDRYFNYQGKGRRGRMRLIRRSVATQMKHAEGIDRTELMTYMKFVTDVMVHDHTQGQHT